MELDLDDVCVGPASDEESLHPSNDDVLLPPLSPEQAGDEQGPPRASLCDSPMFGRFAGWLVSEPVPPTVAPAVVLGLAELEWRLSAPSPALVASHAAANVFLRARGREPWAYLQYEIKEACFLQDRVELPHNFDCRVPLASQRIRTICSRCLFLGARSLDAVTDALDMLVGTVLVLSAAVAGGLHDGVRDVLVRSLALGDRLPVPRIPFRSPPLALLKRIRKQERELKVSAQPYGPQTLATFMEGYNDVLFFLPPGVAEADQNPAPRRRFGRLLQPEDPVKLFRGLNVVQYLRSSRFFGKVMDAQHHYKHGFHAAPRDASSDPSRTAYDRAASRLDMVDMLIDRRIFAADRKFDRIASIHLYSDSSPVTGEELQGMVCDVVLKDHTNRRSVLPGSSLAYGCFNAVSKMVALVWAIFLIAGPTQAGIQYFVDKVLSITTDSGTEIHMVEVVDFLAAFMMWMEGVPLSDCAHLVDHDRRLLHNAVRLSGWGHGWSNLMKAIAGVCPKWPLFLERMRVLIAFYRNKTWRRWARRALKHSGINLAPLKTFSANIAKWRYQTIPACQHDLLELRAITQMHLRPEFYKNAKDQKFIASVFQAAKDDEFWAFTEASYTFLFMPSEACRRWGMTCNCAHHIEQRQAGKNIFHVFYNGRKLATVWPHLEEEKRQRSRLLATLLLRRWRATLRSRIGFWQCSLKKFRNRSVLWLLGGAPLVHCTGTHSGRRQGGDAIVGLKAVGEARPLHAQDHSQGWKGYPTTGFGCRGDARSRRGLYVAC